MTGLPLPRWFAALAVALLVAAPAGPAVAADADADGAHVEAPGGEAVCPVCALREGTRIPEPVRATREIDGVRYRFCSAACAAEFDRDPGPYRGAGAGGDSLQVVPLVDFGAARVATAPT